MSTADTELHIGRCPSIPHDGSRRIIAGGRLDQAQRQADDDLMAELAAAMRPIPGEDIARDAGRRAWKIHQQQRGEEL